MRWESKTPNGGPIKGMICAGVAGGGRCDGEVAAVLINNLGAFNGGAACASPRHRARVEQYEIERANRQASEDS